MPKYLAKDGEGNTIAVPPVADVPDDAEVYMIRFTGEAFLEYELSTRGRRSCRGALSAVGVRRRAFSCRFFLCITFARTLRRRLLTERRPTAQRLPGEIGAVSRSQLDVQVQWSQGSHLRGGAAVRADGQGTRKIFAVGRRVKERRERRDTVICSFTTSCFASFTCNGRTR